MIYKEIQEIYLRHYGKSIKTCWVADAKRELGFTVRIAPNRININTSKHQCPNV
jgi:hypothetical protein